MTRFHHQDNEAMLNTMLAMSARRQRRGVAGFIGMMTIVVGATVIAAGLGALVGL